MPPHFDEEGVAPFPRRAYTQAAARWGRVVVSDFHADCIHRLDERLGAIARERKGCRGLARVVLGRVGVLLPRGDGDG